MSRIYNSYAGADQLTDERGAMSANPRRSRSLYAGAVTEALADQDQLFENAFAVLEEAIANRVFPGASIAITLSGRLMALKAFGRFTYEDTAPEVTTETIFVPLNLR